MKNSLRNATLCIHSLQIQGMLVLTEMNKKFDNSGFLSKFFLLLQQYLGFKYHISTVSRRERDEGLMQNKIDLAITLVQTFERLKIMDFSEAFSVTSVKFVVAAPAELSPITAIFRPFLLHVWIAIFLTFVISVIIFSIIFRKEAKLHRRKYVKISEIAWALFGSFTYQGNDLFSPIGKSCQLLVAGWIFAIFIISSSYSGALMSFISFPGRESVPRTYSELVKRANNGDYIICTNFKSSIIKFISESTEGAGVELKKFSELNNIKDSWPDENLANLIVKEKYAYIFYDEAINIFISLFGSKNFLVSEDQLFPRSFGFAISKKFPYKKEINEAVLRCIEAGFLVKFQKDEKFQAEMKHQSIFQMNGDDFQVLNITDLAGPLSLLIIGYCLSLVAFLIELTIGKLC